MKKLLRALLLTSVIVVPAGLVGVGCAESVDSETTSDIDSGTAVTDTGSKDSSSGTRAPGHGHPPTRARRTR
ncbi:MAG: hypothetical protein IPJ34_24130 [Myxococcales bacterium]|nr:hypothetical protein [Myxococcales bacterium]